MKQVLRHFLGSRIWYDEIAMPFTLTAPTGATVRLCGYARSGYGWMLYLTDTDRTIRSGLPTLAAARDTLRKALEARLDELDAMPRRTINRMG